MKTLPGELLWGELSGAHSGEALAKDHVGMVPLEIGFGAVSQLLSVPQVPVWATHRCQALCSVWRGKMAQMTSIS